MAFRLHRGMYGHEASWKRVGMVPGFVVGADNACTVLVSLLGAAMALRLVGIDCCWHKLGRNSSGMARVELRLGGRTMMQ